MRRLAGALIPRSPDLFHGKAFGEFINLERGGVKNSLFTQLLRHRRSFQSSRYFGIPPIEPYTEESLTFGRLQVLIA